MTLLFWFLLGTIVFSIVGYGALWIGLAHLMPPRQTFPPRPQKANVLIAARNEAQDIGQKIASLRSQDPGLHEIDVLIVSDGSEDATAEIAREAATDCPSIQILELAEHGGKAAALNAGLSRIAPDRVVIFSDANSILAPGALQRLLDCFADPAVGGAIGQLDIHQRGGPLDRAERLYWTYDNRLKAAEDRVAGTVSAQGTLYAVQRSLIGAVPGDMADDLFISLGVVDRGFRLAYAPGAVAREAVTSAVGKEFGRRVRSTERGWRGLMHYAHLMNPARTGLYAFQLFFHKALRRIVAFLLPLLLVVNGVLITEGLVYLGLFVAQVAVYGLALATLLWPGKGRIPGSGAATMLVLGHAAIVWAILRFSVGVRSTKWSPVRRS